MSDEQFFKHPGLPFVECRYSRDSGRHFKSHIHRTFSIGAVEEGEVVYRIDTETVKLQPGSLALINPEIKHSCNPVESGKRSFYMLHLDIDWCLRLQQSRWRTASFRPAETALLESESIYQQYIETANLLLKETDLLQKEQVLAGLVDTVFMKSCDFGPLKKVPSLKIEHLKQQLGGNLGVDITLNQLAGELKANPYKLLRQFKAETGLTPHAYRLNCRIELARKLLQAGSGLSQVALHCGFFDQSHFHRHFKAITTVTPKEYQVNFMQ